MKTVHTMASDELASIPKRRSYSPQLKSQVVTQTQVPGASVAGVALAHGIKREHGNNSAWGAKLPPENLPHIAFG